MFTIRPQFQILQHLFTIASLLKLVRSKVKSRSFWNRLGIKIICVLYFLHRFINDLAKIFKNCFYRTFSFNSSVFIL